MIICQSVFQYKIHLRQISLSPLQFYVFILFLYLALLTKHSREPVDVFSITAHIFLNLFIKICPLFEQIFITCLKCSRASFSLSSCSKKMHWGRGWNGKGGAPVMHLIEWGDILNIQKVPNGKGVRQLCRVKDAHRPSPPPWKSLLNGILSAK